MHPESNVLVPIQDSSELTPNKVKLGKKTSARGGTFDCVGAPWG
jgi:hypothetical protein